jgi:hypothetical protein
LRRTAQRELRQSDCGVLQFIQPALVARVRDPLPENAERIDHRIQDAAFPLHQHDSRVGSSFCRCGCRFEIQ